MPRPLTQEEESREAVSRQEHIDNRLARIFQPNGHWVAQREYRYTTYSYAAGIQITRDPMNGGETHALGLSFGYDDDADRQIVTASDLEELAMLFQLLAAGLRRNINDPLPASRVPPRVVRSELRPEAGSVSEGIPQPSEASIRQSGTISYREPPEPVDLSEQALEDTMMTIQRYREGG